MDSPRYTVIVPMFRFRADEAALLSLRGSTPPSGGLQIIVVEGAHPARQRNAALARAEGEIVVFLDNDCSINSRYWKELEKVLARPEVEIVGGPAILRPEAAAWEKIFDALLTHTLIVGTVAARYSPRGKFRVATQSDLILCNLAVRRSIFQKIGLLSIKLYPNEENEWLDRAYAAGASAYYDPDLRVSRPQRATPGQLGLTLLRYGIGRTRQFQVSGWRFTFHQFLPVMLIATIVALVYWRLEAELIILWLAAAAVIAATCNTLPNGSQRIVAGLIAPLIPLTYAVGQVWGWVALLLPARVTPPEIVLRDALGNKISGALDKIPEKRGDAPE